MAKIILPNVRKFFVPDPGMLLCEADLEGADAQIVAWEANDEDLKKAFRSKIKLHLKNARDVYPQTVNMTDDEILATNKPKGMYYNCKRRVHGYNYGSSTKTMAQTLRSTIIEEEAFKAKWFSLHPGIAEWHRRTQHQLYGIQCWKCDTVVENVAKKCPNCNSHLGITVRNKFGYRILYFNYIEGLLPQALAWIPQSSVAINCLKGGVALEDTYPWIEMLLQVHDSLVFQFPLHYADRIPEIHQTLRSVTVPYPDPLNIDWGFAVSGKSWGDAKEHYDIEKELARGRETAEV